MSAHIHLSRGEILELCRAGEDGAGLDERMSAWWLEVALTSKRVGAAAGCGSSRCSEPKMNQSSPAVLIVRKAAPTIMKSASQRQVD